jgi:hypothetical protein
MPGPVAQRLLEALMLRTTSGRELIGRLHATREMRSFAELLIDLGADRPLALDLAQALKDRVARR